MSIIALKILLLLVAFASIQRMRVIGNEPADGAEGAFFMIYWVILFFGSVYFVIFL